MVELNFNPNIRHPYYFIRKGIYKSILKNKHFINGKVMDFGCGTKPYKSIFEYKEYIGVDYYHEENRDNLQNVDVFYDGKRLPFDNNTFDSIISTEVFEHIFNIDEIFSELNRVLRPGGKILFTCPFVWIEHEAPYDYARYTRFALKDIISKNGFKVIIEEKTENYITTLAQLKVFYNWQYILPKLKLYKVPFVKNILYHNFITLPNLVALLKSRIYPSTYDLYLNNVFVIEKV